MSTYISASQIVGESLHAPNPPKEIQNARITEKYTRTYLQYNYGTKEKPYYAEPLFELTITNGTIKRNAKKALKLNLKIRDLGDLAGMAQLNLGFANVVNKYKGKYGLRNFSPEHPGDLRGAIFFPADESGIVIQGSDAICSLKMNEKTVFKILKPKADGTYEEETLEQDRLNNKSVTCSVIVSARDLYHATALPIPQLFVRSCLILSMTENGEVEHTKSDMVKQYL